MWSKTLKTAGTKPSWMTASLDVKFKKYYYSIIAPLTTTGVHITMYCEIKCIYPLYQ